MSTKISNYEQVGEFNRKFSLHHEAEGPPRALTADEYLYRIKFMAEELEEYAQATEEGDMVKALDALCDLVYVALGTAHFHRFPFDAAWRKVHRANMAKERVACASDGPRHSIYDVIKPPGWRPPEEGLQQLLDDVTIAWERHS